MDRTSGTRPVGLSSDEVRRKKTSFTLDFASSTTAQQSDSIAAKRAKQELLNEGVLMSPDVSLLALATPDLERLIMQQAYGASAASATTPPGAAAAAASVVTTPTQVLFPRSVTEEQEAYARGFIDALLELQRQQKSTSSPHLQVVPDPRAGFSLPWTSPSDEGQTSLYTTLAPLPRVIPQQMVDAGVKLPLLEFLPNQAMPLSVLRPGSLSLPDALSPGVRRSAVVPPFGIKPFPPFVNDSETLDLSPSGRFATRNMEQSVVNDKKLGQTSIASSTACILNVERSSDEIYPLVVDARSESSTREHRAAETFSRQCESMVVSTMKPAMSQLSSVNTAKELPFVSAALPTQPIDMSIQELAKIERKREKNRHAAQKCRLLKLERIERLEKRISELKHQNEVLSGASDTLRDQVNQLKQLIVQHVEGGCQIMTVHSLQTT